MTSVKLFKTIAFIGFGLINSSLARVVKTKGLAEKIHAYSRSEATRAKIKKLNIVDHIYDNSTEAVKGADLVVLGIPVGATRDTVNTFASSLSPHEGTTRIFSIFNQPFFESEIANLYQQFFSVNWFNSPILYPFGLLKIRIDSFDFLE